MFALAFLIISSIIGAGFATGAELVVFFANSAIHYSVISIMVAATLFGLIGLIIWLSEKSFMQNRYLFVPIYATFFVVLTAGMRTLVGPYFTILVSITCVIIVMLGFDKLMKLNTPILLFILIVIVVIGIPSIGSHEINYGNNGLLFTLFWALIYGGLNCVFVLPVVKKARERLSLTSVLGAAVITSIVIGVLVFIILGSVDRGYEIPILSLSTSPFIMVSVFLCIFTSMFIALFNIDTSLGTKKKASYNSSHRLIVLILICAMAFVLSFIGFTKVIGIFYPLIGVFVICYFSWHGICLIYRQTPSLLHRSSELDRPPPLG